MKQQYRLKSSSGKWLEENKPPITGCFRKEEDDELYSFWWYIDLTPDELVELMKSYDNDNGKNVDEGWIVNYEKDGSASLELYDDYRE